MILLIDNYDSFSYNLYQYVGEINPNIKVIKNDAIDIKQIEKLNLSHLIISPGPGRPKEAGICEEAINYFKDKMPILGICLGHQAICEVFGSSITYAKSLMHGKTSLLSIQNDFPIFKGLPSSLIAARYHSLIADRNTIPPELLIIAQDGDGQVMGVKHRDFNLYGLQFHPESVLTENGKTIIENFLKLK
ncbi:MAG: aminodeoxychorismate/anthranilate synthase component II [Elusimicrobiota bacterium]|jgi:anthranilate synthase component 2|nr:aminodeoxychorismate/anthranilate synthase component II [Elusimicrobiota bacterium]